jgi:hypothetical protein
MDSRSVTKSFNIELDNNTLEQYEELLSNFNNWKEYKREIKLNSILEDKKIEFTLDISGHAHGVMYVNVLVDDDVNLQQKNSRDGQLAIKHMKFILKGNNVLELEITIKTMTTEWGKIIRNLIESGVDLKLKQHIVDNKVRSFYFTHPKMVA